MKDAWVWAAGAECAYRADWHPGQIYYWMLAEGEDSPTVLLLDESNASFLKLMYSAGRAFSAALYNDPAAHFHTRKVPSEMMNQ